MSYSFGCQNKENSIQSEPFGMQPKAKKQGQILEGK